MCEEFKKALFEEGEKLGLSPNLSDHELSKDSVLITVDGPISVTLPPVRKFIDDCVKSGMRETRCVACGCYLLTRGEEQLCPPCREKRAVLS
jgi:hypothetical protein